MVTKLSLWRRSTERRASKDTDESSTGSSSGGFESSRTEIEVLGFGRGEDLWLDGDLEKGFEAGENEDKKEAKAQLRGDERLGLNVSGAKTWRRAILFFTVVSALCVIALKWFVAVMMRKIFLWLEETFVGGTSLFGSTASAFWQALFLDHLEFYTVFGITIFMSFTLSLSEAMLRALPVRLAGAYARARRARLVDIALNTNVLTEMDFNATYLLEQVSLLFEYEANVKHQRISCIIRIAFVAFFCLILFWQGTLLTLVFLLIILGLQFSLQEKMLEKPTARRVELIGKVHASIVDVLRGADVVATHNMERFEMETLAAKEAPGVEIDREMWRVLFVVGFPEIALLSAMMPGVILLARLMFDVTDSLSDAANTLFALMAMFFVFDEGHKCLSSLIESNSQAHEYAQALESVNAALAAAPAHLHATSGAEDPEDEDDDAVGPGPLVFDDVTIQYPRASAPVVRNVSFAIPQGLTMAIVAESGGGKSTLFRVASALVRHQGGNVFYGDVPLNDLTKHAIRAHMGFVSQDSMLFARSIRENIWYGNAGEPDDAVLWSVLEKLGLDVWAHTMSDGLDTVLESERMVSGGQAQRLQIARLLCRQGLHYALLDECMSALDPVMRVTVTQALKVFLRGKTAMVITHSHDTVANLCDKVLDLGKLQRGDDRAVLPTKEYLASLQKGKRVQSSVWHAIFNRSVGDLARSDDA
ncbi:ABC transporter ATP-binding protein [Hondaea fermentalgiana]|uniref:ABC transporter ATP-binding protein n=1 Tax=Hondaea fermentalgiana TaxID=2315210 RepID=A0A2R5GRF5_9STRA|nr:ABC transporter ATP-binding protein [Hondaea fermentalgiana]|eukprot:GBG33466.1 ABC transporter ATP-binding protein [Hondaea fermentalgiana]